MDRIPITTSMDANGNDLLMLPSCLYGWIEIDDMKFPYIKRENVKFVSVRMAENYFQSMYQNQYPSEIAHAGPLVGHYATEQEASLLNEIKEHPGGLPNVTFTTSDLLVQLDKFQKINDIIKQHCENEIKNEIDPPLLFKYRTNRTIGWVELNDIVVPYIKRGDLKLLPIAIVKSAVNLLAEAKPRTFKARKLEVTQIQRACLGHGLKYKITLSNRFVTLQRLRACEQQNLSHVKILPDNDWSSYEL